MLTQLDVNFTIKTVPMGLFDRRKNDTKALTPVDEPSKLGSGWFYPIGIGSQIGWSNSQYLRDFYEVPEVNAVISTKVRAFSNGKIKIISKATGLEVPKQEPFVQALMEPNYFQSQLEFLQQTKFYHEIYGNEILYFLHPVGMPKSIKGIFSLPPEIVFIREDNSVPFFMRQDNPANYFYRWGAVDQPLTESQFIHINRANTMAASPTSFQMLGVNDFAKSSFWGSPALSALQGPVANIRAAYEARNTLIVNRGALGILTNSAEDGTKAMLPLDPKMKKELQDEYRNYGLSKGQWQIIMTSLNLKWQQMSIDTDKLKLFEEVEADFLAICNGFGVPPELVMPGQTYENKLRAERQMYQNTIIPEAIEWIGAMNKKAETMDKSWYITMTLDHLPVFQENAKERAQSLSMTAAAFEKLITTGVMTVPQAQAELQKYGIQ